MIFINYLFRDCVVCEVKYIEDCPHLEVAIGGKPELPQDCWREDLIKNEMKPHKKNDKPVFKTDI